jgi:hypothetical protein
MEECQEENSIVEIAGSEGGHRVWKIGARREHPSGSFPSVMFAL